MTTYNFDNLITQAVLEDVGWAIELNMRPTTEGGQVLQDAILDRGGPDLQPWGEVYKQCPPNALLDWRLWDAKNAIRAYCKQYPPELRMSEVRGPVGWTPLFGVQYLPFDQTQLYCRSHNITHMPVDSGVQYATSMYSSRRNYTGQVEACKRRVTVLWHLYTLGLLT